MYKLSLALPLLFTIVFATNERRDVSASTIIADIDAIDAGVNDLRTELAGYTGGLLSETPLVAGFTEIEVANRKGYADANLRASNFSASDSTAIVNSVIDTVGVDIPDSIQELVAKKSLFEAAGQDALVVGLLDVLLYDHDSFSAAVSAKLTADLTAGASAVAEIHNAIQSGINAFSS